MYVNLLNGNYAINGYTIMIKHALAVYKYITQQHTRLPSISIFKIVL